VEAVCPFVARELVIPWRLPPVEAKMTVTGKTGKEARCEKVQ
jgi:hypothetical protein